MGGRTWAGLEAYARGLGEEAEFKRFRAMIEAFDQVFGKDADPEAMRRRVDALLAPHTTPEGLLTRRELMALWKVSKQVIQRYEKGGAPDRAEGGASPSIQARRGGSMARGSIAKRPGKNGIYWRLRARDTSGSVREIRLLWKDRSGDIITSQSAAQERLGELVRELQGPPPAYVGKDKRRIRFVEVASEWLSVHPNKWARSDYEALLKSRILPALGDVPIAELSKIRLQQYVLESKAAPETVRKCMLVVRSVVDHAIDRNLVAHNTARGVKRPKVERPSLSVWTPEQITLFLNAFPPDEFKWRMFCEVLLFAGLRFGEAVALTPGQVKAETLIVSNSWNAKHEILKQPKSGRPRSVDLHPTLKRDLLSYLERSGVPRDGLLFPRPDGKHLDGSWFTRNIWDPAIKRAGVPRIRVHDARHTFVAHLLEAGENPVYVKEQAGHTSAAFTLDRYGHLIASRNRTRRDVGTRGELEDRAG